MMALYDKLKVLTVTMFMSQGQQKWNSYEIITFMTFSSHILESNLIGMEQVFLLNTFKLFRFETWLL